MHDNREVIVSAYEPSELRFCLTGNDALTLLEFIHKSLYCNSKDDFTALFPMIRELLPFDFAYSFLAHHGADNGLIQVFNANISFPKGWVEHLALTNLYNSKQLEWNKAIISHREKEVLDWLKQGKSSWDISIILGISERTVNFHVYKIMQKLGVTKRPQAVAVAARLGLVDFD